MTQLSSHSYEILHGEGEGEGWTERVRQGRYNFPPPLSRPGSPRITELNREV
jgi:hypothetical protein